MTAAQTSDLFPARRLPPLPESWLSLAHAFVHQARSRPHRLAVVDSLGTRLTYQRLLTAAVALANKLSKTLQDSNCVGILLPPSAGAVIANLAVTLLGKVTVNLNYTTGPTICQSAIEQCNIKHVVTSCRFLKRVGLDLEAEIWIDLDEVKDDISLLQKIKAWTEAEYCPEAMLGHLFPGLETYRKIRFPRRSAELIRNKATPADRLDDPATIIFTSGSTGKPKGVVLSHANLLSNIHAIRLQGHVQAGEIVLGVIPFFHSFGLTMTLWAPLCLGETIVYHYNPLDARRISELCELHKATTLICTPTMMSSYLKRCPKEKFASLRTCILGGEKLKSQQRLEFEHILGMPPYEGYGLAETSPVVACNVPAKVTLADGRVVDGTKFGTVGLPLPGTSIRICDENNGMEIPTGKAGMIKIKGPQVMMGYLNQPEATEKVLHDGWFTTGDIGYLDQDGFLTITGRLSQFSKIGGEMVPHLAVEDEIMKVTGIKQQTICVTSVADQNRGERLIVVYSDLGMTPERVVELLRSSNLSRLWIPASADFIRIDKMPILPNGKLDLNSVKSEVARAVRDNASKTEQDAGSHAVC